MDRLIGTKLGWFVEAWTPGALETVLAAGGAGLKVMTSEPEPVERFLADNPGAVVVARQFHDNQDALLRQGEAGGRQVAAQMEARFGHLRELRDAYGRLAGDGRLYVEGLNEIGLWDDAPFYNAFTVGFADECRRRGLQPAVFNFPTGNPPGYRGDGSPEDLWAYLRHYEDGIRACQSAGGAIVLHEYDYPNYGAHWTWHPLRYRRLRAALPARYHSIPFIIGETGIDHGVIGPVANPKLEAGWRAARWPDGRPVSEEEYAEGLARYDDALLADEYLLAAMVFQAGGFWDSFLVRPGVITDMIRIRKRRRLPPPTPPADVPSLPPSLDPPAPTPEPTPQPPDLARSEAIVRRWPAPRGAASKPAVWQWWSRAVEEVVQTRPHLADDDVVRVGLGLLATIWCESGGDPDARGDWTTRPDGTRVACSRGLFQLNSCGGAGSRLMREIGLSDADQLHQIDVQFRHARALIAALEAELYWSRQEQRAWNPGGAIQSVQRSSADPTGAGYGRAYTTLARELGWQEETAMPYPTATIGNLTVIDLRDQFPSTYAGRELSAIRRLIIHHSGDAALPADAPVEAEVAALRGIDAYHRRRDWPSPTEGPGRGIAYHLALMPSGRVYLVGDWATERWHSGSRDPAGGNPNRDGLAILLQGNYDDGPPSELQLLMAARLANECRYQLGNGSLPAVGHQEVAATRCPGRTWPRWRGLLQPSEPPRPDPRSAAHIQLDVIWALAQQAPPEVRTGIERAVIALKDAIGID
ncbi:MAG: hypothetical protein KatS3mg060_1152 [Dehalococcoidia bacterium]|nr:MAG: hypothetical protein KatS3mg060_1152 [Dehalococcoidia bacterium]